MIGYSGIKAIGLALLIGGCGESVISQQKTEDRTPLNHRQRIEDRATLIRLPDGRGGIQLCLPVENSDDYRGKDLDALAKTIKQTFAIGLQSHSGCVHEVCNL